MSSLLAKSVEIHSTWYSACCSGRRWANNGIYRDAQELVAELEFVWNQIKNNSNSSSTSESSPQARRQFQQPASGTDGPMKVLSPMSEDDAAEQEFREHQQEDDNDEEDEAGGGCVKKGDKWSKKVERALVRLSAEVAALREQITTSREWRSQRQRTIRARLSWFFWLGVKHFTLDLFIIGIVLLWMRRRKDRRLEDQVRAILKLGREYIRKILPSR